jgi:hypothetical protein
MMDAVRDFLFPDYLKEVRAPDTLGAPAATSR